MQIVVLFQLIIQLLRMGCLNSRQSKYRTQNANIQSAANLNNNQLDHDQHQNGFQDSYLDNQKQQRQSEISRQMRERFRIRADNNNNELENKNNSEEQKPNSNKRNSIIQEEDEKRPEFFSHRNHPFKEMMEPRDRQILIDLPLIKGRQKIKSAHLKRWITEVAQAVFSSAFNFYFKREMTETQTKIYCSQNIMKNIVNLNQNYELTVQQFQMIDKQLKKESIIYIDSKYPLTDSVNISKELTKLVKQVDKSYEVQNNQIFNCKINFEYQSSGNYNYFIMLVINEQIKKMNKSIQVKLDENQMKKKQSFSNKVQQKSSNIAPGQKQKKLFTIFQQKMNQLFQMVYDQNQMNHINQFYAQCLKSQQQNLRTTKIIEDLKIKNHSFLQQKNSINDLEQLQNYKNKVKGYTQHQIGRKIQQSVQHFTDSQLQNDDLRIKHPSILRMLTKWCQQLKKQFTTPNYYMNRSQNLFLHTNFESKFILPWWKLSLCKSLEQQYQKIESQMKEIQHQSYDLQLKLLHNQKYFSKQQRFLGTLDQISGKFSINLTNNLHNYMITYLNRLIHGLMTVSKQWYQNSLYSMKTQFPYPVNLITFKISDLFRCRIYSNQEEIIALYKNITILSLQNQDIEIVRIKNRLKQNTNDILINFKFKKQILCEVQLAIKPKISDFTEYSNHFQHFIYQLKRSEFGILTQLCSTRISLDGRKDIYQKLIKNQRIVKRIKQDKQQNIKASNLKICNFKEMMMISHPFICSVCNVIYYSNSQAVSHRKSKTEQFYICGSCQIKEISQRNQQQLLKVLYLPKQLKNNVQSIIFNPQYFQESQIQYKYGFIINIEQKNAEPIFFKKFKHKDVRYLIGKNKLNQYYQIAAVKQKYDIKKFFQKNIVFRLKKQQNFMEPFSTRDVLIKYLYPSQMKSDFQKEAQIINLQKLDLTSEQCKQILQKGSKSCLNKVKKLLLGYNDLDKLPFQDIKLPNLQELNLNQNRPICNLKCLKSMEKLQTLSILNCDFENFPNDIFDLVSLKKICFFNDHLTQIPNQIKNLVNLVDLQIDTCVLRNISKYISSCTKLQRLLLQKNEISILPHQICDLKQLKILILNQNSLTVLPQRIGQLQNLNVLLLQQNKQLQELPKSFVNLKLQTLNIAHTSITSLQFILPITRLKHFEFDYASFKQGPKDLQRLTNLTNLQIINCQQVKLPDKIDSMHQLQTIYIKDCQKLILPKSFRNLNPNKISFLQISTLSLDYQIFLKMNGLKQLYIQNCNIKQLPQLSKCVQLSILVIAHNQIQSLQRILNIRELTSLQIRYNNLTEFDQNLFTMSKLKLLQVSMNKIKTIKKININALSKTNMKQICIDGNQLTQIPEGLFLCHKLQRLDMAWNKITKISDKIKNLKKLNYISIDRLMDTSNFNEQLKNKINLQYEVFPPIYPSDKCHFCSIKLNFPVYWLYWQTQKFTFSCRKCIQENINNQKNLLQKYNQNAILLLGQFKQKCETQQIGNKIEETQRSIITSWISQQKCDTCQAIFKYDQARFKCLICTKDEQTGEEQSNVCLTCLNEEGSKVQTKELGPNLHLNHPRLRIIYEQNKIDQVNSNKSSLVG